MARQVRTGFSSANGQGQSQTAQPCAVNRARASSSFAVSRGFTHKAQLHRPLKERPVLPVCSYVTLGRCAEQESLAGSQAKASPRATAYSNAAPKQAEDGDPEPLAEPEPLAREEALGEEELLDGDSVPHASADANRNDAIRFMLPPSLCFKLVRGTSRGQSC
jgi:hypothetical protein